MCKYFSCIATKDGRVLWTEEDSHEEVITRSGLKDCNLENRDFVRIEVDDGDMKNYKIDEQDTLPRWFEKRESEFYKKVESLLKKLAVAKPKCDAINKEYQTKCDAINKEYQTKCDAINKEYQTKWDAIYKELQPKREAINKELQPKRDAVDKEYQTKRDAVDKEYQTKRDAVDKELQPKRDAIYKELQPKRDAIYKEYQTKCDAINKEYQTKRDAIYGKIKGYLPKERAIKSRTPP